MTTVGVIGLGNMGSRVARRFIDAAHDVVVWNRTRAKADELAEAGATPVDAPVEVAERASVVVTIVADPQALYEVVEGARGVARATTETTLLEMSTVGPSAIDRVRRSLPSTIELLDTPVLGSTSEVEQGRLVVFAGGAEGDLARVTPLLEVLGRVVHVGPLGSGAAAKLVANSTLLAALTAVGEAVALGRRLGLSDDAIFGVLSTTPLSAQAERRRRSIENDDYPLRFALSLAVKDADLVTRAAAAVGLDARVAAAARDWFSAAESRGLGGDDYSTVLKHILDS